MKACTAFLAFFLASILSYAQDGAGGVAATGGAPAGKAALPRGYRTITLGLGLEELKTALKRDSDTYIFREERDVYFLPLSGENYVEAVGRNFIKRAFFQLHEQSLFVISMELNTASIDYYSVFTTFMEKYGEPLSLDPQKAVWEEGDVRVSIERPLTVKYIDRAVFDSLVTKTGGAASASVFLRDNFLQDF